ncbi:MAG: hypothetical protein ACI9OJ_005210 [Myxococcota bacterium]|jgi:hypothetical protein
MRIALLIALLGLPPLASAAPCGDVPIEGRCDGNSRIYCASGELVTEACDACCGWVGQRFDCVTCPTGACEDECKEGVDVFGCSLQNTHEFSCAVGADLCTDRIFTACPDGQVCDESTTSKCRPLADVDLCNGIDAAGECKGNVHKRCEGGALIVDDCANKGESCAPSGCTSTCPPACEEGTIGCLPDGRAFSCIPDVLTGCLTQIGKPCGGKVCHEGLCKFASEIEPDVAEPEVVEPIAEPAPEESSSGCLIQGDSGSMSDGSLVVLATLLGFLLFITTCRRRRGSQRTEEPDDQSWNPASE